MARLRRGRGCATLQLDILIQHVIEYVHDASVLLAMAGTCKAALARVHALPLTHVSKLNGGVHARRLPDAVALPHFMPNLRALHILAFGRCDVCFENNVRAPFRTNWNLFAHDRCVRERCVNAFFLTPDTREKLLYANAPFDLRTLPVRGRNIMAAYFWKRDDGVLPAHWTIEGVQSLTETEALERGFDVPATERQDRRLELVRVMDALEFARAPGVYFW